MEFNTYNEQDNSELRRLQLVLLDNTKLFASICERYNLRYFMVGGTMLGAIRHKGFIPWDDDIDIGMPRADYEKFLTVAPGELPDGYAILNYKTDKDYHRYFSRLVNKNVRVYNCSNSVEIVENAWLDIFPYDGMPRGKIRRNIYFWRMMFMRFWYQASCFEELVNLNRPGRPGYQQFIIGVLKRVKIGRRLDTDKIMRKMEKKLCKYPYDSSDIVVSMFGAYMTREMIERSIFGETVKYPFEDTEFNGPEKYDEFLRHYYGDYMQVPNDGDKDKHSIRKIEYLNA